MFHVLGNSIGRLMVWHKRSIKWFILGMVERGYVFRDRSQSALVPSLELLPAITEMQRACIFSGCTVIVLLGTKG